MCWNFGFRNKKDLISKETFNGMEVNMNWFKEDSCHYTLKVLVTHNYLSFSGARWECFRGWWNYSWCALSQNGSATKPGVDGSHQRPPIGHIQSDLFSHWKHQLWMVIPFGALLQPLPQPQDSHGQWVQRPKHSGKVLCRLWRPWKPLGPALAQGQWSQYLQWPVQSKRSRVGGCQLPIDTWNQQFQVTLS